MLSRIKTAVLVVISLALTSCGNNPLSPDEIHQQQNAIITEIAQKYGFADVSIASDEIGEPIISDGEIVRQKVDVRIGLERGLDLARECHTVVLWKKGFPPDLMDSQGRGTLQTEVSGDEADAWLKTLPDYAPCFIP